MHINESASLDFIYGPEVNIIYNMNLYILESFTVVRFLCDSHDTKNIKL